MRRCWGYIILCANILLAGCSFFSFSGNNHACSVAAADTDPAYYSQSCQQKRLQQSLAQKLRSDGLQVVQVGDETTIVLNTDRFFNLNSNNADINTPVMKDIADFINSYEGDVTDIKVTGYPKISGNAVRNLALSRAQAEKITHDLQVSGLDMRLISADAKNDPSEVSRIEIFFRLAPPTNVFH